MSQQIDENFHLLVNPFPILPVHFTIPARKHQYQAIYQNYGEMHRFLSLHSELMVFYNGPKCMPLPLIIFISRRVRAASCRCSPTGSVFRAILLTSSL